MTSVVGRTGGGLDASWGLTSPNVPAQPVAMTITRKARDTRRAKAFGPVWRPARFMVRAHGVGGLLDLVDGGLVLAGPHAELTEEASAECRRGRRHGQAARNAARRERVRGDGLRLRALDVNVFKPEVEAQHHRAGVECPLGTRFRLALAVIGSSRLATYVLVQAL